MLTRLPSGRQKGVAPFTGAWIEIVYSERQAYLDRSLPSRERGLKLWEPGKTAEYPAVAPFTGAWIEIKAIRMRR